MVEPDQFASVALGKAALVSMLGLATTSQDTDQLTLRSMYIAERDFEMILAHKDDYAELPGEVQKNRARRQRLAHILMSSC